MMSKCDHEVCNRPVEAAQHLTEKEVQFILQCMTNTGELREVEQDGKKAYQLTEKGAQDVGNPTN